MRDDPDVVGHRWLQVFKVPFVTRIADFLEPILRLLRSKRLRAQDAGC